MTELDARAYRVLWEAIRHLASPADRFHMRLEIEVARALGRITDAQARELHQAVYAEADLTGFREGKSPA